MNITIHIGSWIVPTALSIAALISASYVAYQDTHRPSRGGYDMPIVGMLAVAAAIASTAMAWTGYFLIELLH